jgi:thiamine-monophosphate kinase
VPSEFELIDAFLAPFGGGEGIGSDCAELAVGAGPKLIVTTDAIVEGVHFDLRRFTPEDVGWKALAVNLSDLAAAGARPRWFVCALGVPRRPRTLQLAIGMARGMSELARGVECALVGGNVTASREWSITITAMGEARRPLSRFGARPGDALVVIGPLGDAAAGLRPRASSAAVRAQRRPVPLVREGLAAVRFASAAIDVSDGLLQDLGHLCRASGVGAEIECSRLPVGAGARRQPDAVDLALSGGEDYALLLAVPRKRLPALRRALAYSEVGAVVRGTAITLLRNGIPRPLPRSRGFDHLR